MLLKRNPDIVVKLNNFYLVFRIVLPLLLFVAPFKETVAQPLNSITTEDIIFESEGIKLSGTLYEPRNSQAAVVIVHGSGPESRMTNFAKLLAKNGISVLTYDKRGVAESGGVYACPEVGTNNIDSTNLELLANDASEAVKMLHKKHKNIPVGLLGFSQAGWIIPIATVQNTLVDFMVLFSCPTITTLEQLRFQFYTNGRKDFWENHTEEDAREHIENDPDRYQFTSTDPKVALNSISIPGLWIFGEKDIQIPVKLCIEQLNAFKVQGKPYDFVLFPELGHNTAFSKNTAPVDISIEWMKKQTLKIKRKETKDKY
ncbi:alpha/beta hydrolase [Galbibacter sp. BG1]|uniref:alpha/beta hydrolase family protein n=1 Tax=Galbibacter sp. BG1 TaxID=1170699 RepID=UPI0015BC9CA2|nr:alpha/beta hydrolase [Galbibacter sp. BG1]QLE02660.1 alpha/beta hydrolase [Galbibacter sp. BG1]